MRVTSNWVTTVSLICTIKLILNPSDSGSGGKMKRLVTHPMELVYESVCVCVYKHLYYYTCEEQFEF